MESSLIKGLSLNRSKIVLHISFAKGKFPVFDAPAPRKKIGRGSPIFFASFSWNAKCFIETFFIL